MQTSRATAGRRSGECGFALLDALLATALLAAFSLALGAGVALHGNAARALDDGERFAAFVALAERVARAGPALRGNDSIGSGATLALVPAESGWVMLLYAARPIYGTLPDRKAGAIRPPLVARVEISGTVTSDLGLGAPFALFFSASGTVAAAAWKPRDPPPPAQPACARVAVSVSDEPARQTYAIDCATGAIERTTR